MYHNFEFNQRCDSIEFLILGSQNMASLLSKMSIWACLRTILDFRVNSEGEAI